MSEASAKPDSGSKKKSKAAKYAAIGLILIGGIFAIGYFPKNTLFIVAITAIIGFDAGQVTEDFDVIRPFEWFTIFLFAVFGLAGGILLAVFSPGIYVDWFRMMTFYDYTGTINPTGYEFLFSFGMAFFLTCLACLMQNRFFILLLQFLVFFGLCIVGAMFSSTPVSENSYFAKIFEPTHTTSVYVDSFNILEVDSIAAVTEYGSGGLVEKSPKMQEEFATPLEVIKKWALWLFLAIAAIFLIVRLGLKGVVWVIGAGILVGVCMGLYSLAIHEQWLYFVLISILLTAVLVILGQHALKEKEVEPPPPTDEEKLFGQIGDYVKKKVDEGLQAASGSQEGD